MPFDKPIKQFLKPIPPEEWNVWKDDYNERIDSFEDGYNGYHLKNDLRAVYFSSSTVKNLIYRNDIKDDDFVVFKFISKIKTGLNITPCIMADRVEEPILESKLIGHKLLGELDQSIGVELSSKYYEQRLRDLYSLTEFKDDVQGIAHSVSDFKEWFRQSPDMDEFAIIFLYDKPYENPLDEIRKMNLGFINSARMPINNRTSEIELNVFVNRILYDQGSSCCPPIKK